MDDRWLGLAVIVAAVFAAAAVGASLSGDGTARWYARRRPRWAPPLRAIGPLWTVLFGALAAAAWATWIQYGTWEFGYLAPYAGLAGTSAYWPVSLFGKRHPGRATVLGLAITVAAGGLAWQYSADAPLAASFTVVFATGAAASVILNAAVWWCGRSLDRERADRTR